MGGREGGGSGSTRIRIVGGSSQKPAPSSFLTTSTHPPSPGYPLFLLINTKSNPSILASKLGFLLWILSCSFWGNFQSCETKSKSPKSGSESLGSRLLQFFSTFFSTRKPLSNPFPDTFQQPRPLPLITFLFFFCLTFVSLLLRQTCFRHCTSPCCHKTPAKLCSAWNIMHMQYNFSYPGSMGPGLIPRPLLGGGSGNETRGVGSRETCILHIVMYTTGSSFEP